MIEYVCVVLVQLLKRAIINGSPRAPLKKRTFDPKKVHFWRNYGVKCTLFQGCPRAPINDRTLQQLNKYNTDILNHKIFYNFTSYMVIICAFWGKMLKNGHFLPQKCHFIGGAEGPLWKF